MNVNTPQRPDLFVPRQAFSRDGWLIIALALASVGLERLLALL